MAEENGTGPQSLVPANDNGDLVSPEGSPELTVAAAARVDRVVLDIARLIGRQLARETFEVGLAANDNRPRPRKEEGREPDGKPPGNRREDPPP
ncbi:hypothetical protein NMG46_18850 [Mesorhizobium sp. LMG 17147]|uniref:hypothetical protein n=1 Tax=Mesorhizobium sp. LMG 17147 TaxID=2963091 RepID=UPI0020C9940D|nr:hypothetical protein [Mesorhizobium sp. LMG 17147]MCP9232296.1 hypothetical protein [Mesorhizobium sp. LMG 17147]